METQRQKKVAQLLQEELALLFIRLSKNSNQDSLITITDVKVPTDLSLAKIYLSIYPDHARKIIMDEINRMKPQIRYEIGTKLGKQLRVVPELKFFLDNSIDHVEIIEKELKGEGNNPIL